MGRKIYLNEEKLIVHSLSKFALNEKLKSQQPLQDEYKALQQQKEDSGAKVSTIKERLAETRVYIAERAKDIKAKNEMRERLSLLNLEAKGEEVKGNKLSELKELVKDFKQHLITRIRPLIEIYASNALHSF